MPNKLMQPTSLPPASLALLFEVGMGGRAVADRRR